MYYETHLVHFELFWAFCDYLGPFWTYWIIVDYFIVILDNFWPFWDYLEQFGIYSLIRFILFTIDYPLFIFIFPFSITIFHYHFPLPFSITIFHYHFPLPFSIIIFNYSVIYYPLSITKYDHIDFELFSNACSTGQYFPVFSQLTWVNTV